MHKKIIITLLLVIFASTCFADDKTNEAVTAFLELTSCKPELNDYSYESLLVYIEQIEAYEDKIYHFNSSYLDNDTRKEFDKEKRLLQLEKRYLRNVPLANAGSEEWKDFLYGGSYYGSDEFHPTICRYPGALRGLFAHYEKVKDNPFLDLDFSKVVSEIFNKKISYSRIYFFDYYGKNISYGAEDAIEDGYLDTTKEVYKILSEQMDNFEVPYKEDIKETIRYLLNDEIDERLLFQQLYEMLNYSSGAIYKVEDIRNLTHPTNGLILKYQGTVVDGILGGYPDFEYHLDYNGKKDISFKRAELVVTLMPEFNERPLVTDAVFIGDDFYIFEINKYLTYRSYDININGEDKVTDFSFKPWSKDTLGDTTIYNELGIQSVEIRENLDID